MPEASTRQVGLSGGTYQLLPNVDPATAATLQGTPGVNLLETTDLAYTLVGMNVSKPPFDNPKVREALNIAIDRSQIVEAAYFGKGQPGGPLSPGAEGLGAAGLGLPLLRRRSGEGEGAAGRGRAWPCR